MIRRAIPADVPAMVELVHGLAEYEKSGHECTLTGDRLHTALFGPNPALFAHVAMDDSSATVAGIAIWFLNYSTWDGTHGIYLEDLYVRPETRGQGLGRALVAALAQEAITHGYSRISWSVLDWNTPSIDFYESLGAKARTEWIGYRLSGAALTGLADDMQV